MDTLDVVILIHAVVLYIVVKWRWWVIRKLVGKDPMVANCHIQGTLHFSSGSEDAHIWDSTFTVPDLEKKGTTPGEYTK